MGIEKYKDIIDLERPKSKNHKPMPLENRAAQFAPFAALVGYDEATEEAARLTESRIELSEEVREELDRKLGEIAESIAEGRKKLKVKLTYFERDPYKDGGAYITEECEIKKIDDTTKSIILKNGGSINISDIYDIIDW